MKQIAARIAWSVGLILAVIVMCFSLVHLAPGDAALVIAGDSGAGDPELIEQIREDLGLDDPYLVQLSRYVGDVASGDFGTSYRFNEPVTSLIGDRIWPTILLVTTALLFAIVIGVLVGVFTARRPESPVSRRYGFSLVGYSMPVFDGYLLIIGPASNVRWFGRRYARCPLRGQPIRGMARYRPPPRAPGTDAGTHLSGPVFGVAGLDVRSSSRTMSAPLEQRGWLERKVVYKHALRNAVIPVITIAGLQFGAFCRERSWSRRSSTGRGLAVSPPTRCSSAMPRCCSVC